MPRPATGSVEEYRHADGQTVTYRARIRAYGQRHRLTLGTNRQGWNRARAENRVFEIMDEVRRGVWTPPGVHHGPHVDDTENLHTTLSRWWASHEGEVDERTRVDYRDFRLRHLLADPLRHQQTATIDARAVDELRARLRGRGLAARSTNMVLQVLAMALDDAVDYGLLDANPARGRRRRARQPAAARSFLEADMVRDLLDVAGEWEQAVPEHQRYGRRALLACLVLSGPRIAELIETDRAALDLHAGVLRLGKKTAAGRGRVLELSFFLVAELRGHVAAMASMGRPLDPDTPLFPTYGRGGTAGRLNASNVRNRLLRECVHRANDRRASQGRLALPDRVTPHTLRRTFASLAFVAGRDPLWVQGQLGHQDPRMTLGVYAQHMKRRNQDRALVWQMMRFADEAGNAAGSSPSSPTMPAMRSDQGEGR
jgi:integrase